MYRLLDGVSAKAESGFGDSVTVPGMELKIDQALDRYGFDTLAALEGYYGSDSEEYETRDIQMMSKIERQVLLHKAEEESRTKAELIARERNPREPNLEPVVPVKEPSTED